MLSVNLQLWEDGVKHDRKLEQLDRWAIQAAEEVTVLAADLQPLVFRQSTRLLSASQSGVGAVLWESAFVLAAHFGDSLHMNTMRCCTCAVLAVGMDRDRL